MQSLSFEGCPPPRTNQSWLCPAFAVKRGTNQSWLCTAFAIKRGGCGSRNYCICIMAQHTLPFLLYDLVEIHCFAWVAVENIFAYASTRLEIEDWGRQFKTPMGQWLQREVKLQRKALCGMEESVRASKSSTEIIKQGIRWGFSRRINMGHSNDLLIKPIW
ncbi:uncharacterized protein LOC132274506 isoform X3 [Cornus florida]|uniref:uncharacterized protein LOC132274506 isoform X3 n=1 Tax=Cornus florida TaxID=4283 RepID=UPI0028A07745|nr:uncharacterized protein LOC132274506 isoform X3 [Cornus florida]